ncbi:MAG: hypothetical protein M3N95_16125 [Actinomycetota bacterium]|nr:hypothetical protein [Actinomycetota bacterium]
MNAPAPYGARRPAAGDRPVDDRPADWSTPTSVRSGAATASQPDFRYERRSRPVTEPSAPPAERGLPGWGALIVLVVIAGVGAVIDVLSGSQSRGGFNYGIVGASVVAILTVRRSAMFPVVIAPPIVYSAVSGGILYIRSGGLHNHKVLFDAAANWLVYGFPAIAAATAAVLIIAGIRLIVHR